MKNRVLIILLIISVISTLLFSSCSVQNSIPEKEKPGESKIRAICELATLECYYHNVAKANVPAGENWILNFGEKDRDLWIEYTGVARVGVDVSEVEITIDGNIVTVSMPKATVLDVGIYDIDESSYKFSEDGINENKITADHQAEAIKDAQEEMRQSVMNNSSVLQNAQARAEDLIENYIFQLGELSGDEYTVNWVYENSTESAESESTTEEQDESSVEEQ